MPRLQIKKPKLEKPKRMLCKKPYGCGREFPYTKKYFHANSQQTWGLHVYCKECRNKYKKTWKQKQKNLNRLKTSRQCPSCGKYTTKKFCSYCGTIVFTDNIKQENEI